ncbi:MAG: glycosyltransferase [Nitrospirae bacterium]|nr:glycosyltransferase [Nitrospirota bacterium]
MNTTESEYYPLVSIVTPVKNCFLYIEQCINSVVSQKYKNVEHILIDGGSTDGTLGIIDKYIKKFPDKIVFKSEKNMGACNAWNEGWLISKGIILGWLGADDFYTPDAIEKVVEFFRVNHQASFVFGKCLLVGQKNQRITILGETNIDINKALSTGINPIPATSAFYKRDIIQNIGNLRIDINICDFDYWIRVGKRYKIYYINDILSAFRVSETSTTGSANSYIQYARERYILMKEHKNRLSFIWFLGYLLSFVAILLRNNLGSKHTVYRIIYLLKRITMKLLFW